MAAGFSPALSDWIGWLGAALIIGAFMGVQLRKVDTTRLRYSMVNAVGAALILVSLYYDFNSSAFVVEVFWLGVSLFGIWQYLRRPR